ncbi:MAG TPA: endonuclease domain-containing protein [Dehalococcoidia bacterium]|nr:endonuclease domain-containing protein [Dehalococcoidia bacterium]
MPARSARYTLGKPAGNSDGPSPPAPPPTLGEGSRGNGTTSEYSPKRAGRRTVERIRGTPAEVQLAAQSLRHRLTPAERLLWDSLRDRRLDGFKFRRQQPLGPFILDFYCAATKLVVELDGAVHETEEQRDRDLARSAQLQSYGCRVIRFTNDQVRTELAIVLGCIRASLTPLPELGEGQG